MKSYLQDLITGGVFVFAVMVLSGSTSNNQIDRYQFGESLQRNFYKMDTQTGEVYSAPKGLFTADGEMHMRSKITKVSNAIN